MGEKRQLNHQFQVILVKVGAVTVSHANRLQTSEQGALRELNIDAKPVTLAPLIAFLLTISKMHGSADDMKRTQKQGDKHTLITTVVKKQKISQDLIAF